MVVTPSIDEHFSQVLEHWEQKRLPGEKSGWALMTVQISHWNLGRLAISVVGS